MRIVIILLLIFISCETKSREKIVPEVNFFDQYDNLIQSNATRTGITPHLIKGIMYCESYMISNAIRFEPDLKTNKRYVSSIPKRYRTNDLAYSSLGLMQLLPGTAYHLGYRGTLKGLFNTEINTYYGTQYILAQIRRFRYQKKVASAYNAGHPIMNPNGTFRNQRYVNNVVRKYREYKRNAEMGPVFTIAKSVP